LRSLCPLALRWPTVTLNQPISTGQGVLDGSKQRMFEVHALVQERCQGTWDLCYMDTDSFIFDIRTPSLATDYETLSTELDLSDLPEGDPLRTTHHKGVLGKMTDEVKGKRICEAVMLSQKNYSLELDSGKAKQACKGVTRRAAAASCRHADYMRVLKTGGEQHAMVAGIRSTKYQLETRVSSKVALSCRESKRHIMADGIHSLPYGHCRLTQASA
jgi:hypothetical protein